MMLTAKVKKVISMLLATVICFSVLVGCNGQEQNNSSSSSSGKQTSGQSSETQSRDADDEPDSIESKTESGASNMNNNKTISDKAGKTNQSSFNSTTQTTPDTKTEETTGMVLKRGINMAGGLGGSGVAAYNDYLFKAKYYQIVKSKGFDHIRLPVNFVPLSGEAPNYTIDKEFLHQLDTAINLALQAELYVVLDFHGYAALVENADGNKQRFYKIWEQIAKRYKKYPDSLFFELLNEPGVGKSGVSPLTNAKLNEIQMEAIRIIRQTNPTRKLVTSVQDANGVWNIWNMKLPSVEEDPNIIVAIHNYTSLEFTHQGQNWGSAMRPDKAHFDDTIKTAIREQLEKCKDYQDRTGRPVWLGEFGMYMGIADVEDIIAYAAYFSKTAEELELGWCWWEFNQGFGLFDTKTDDWKPGIADALFR